MDLIYSLITNYGGPAATWALTALFTFIGVHVLSKILSERARAIVGRALDEIRDAALEVWQTYVSEMKAAGSDGKWTDAEKGEARRKALAIAKSNIGVKGLKALARVLGLKDVGDWLETKLESVVAQAKASGAMAPRADVGGFLGVDATSEVTPVPPR